jgi:hypothetical protein
MCGVAHFCWYSIVSSLRYLFCNTEEAMEAHPGTIEAHLWRPALEAHHEDLEAHYRAEETF